MSRVIDQLAEITGFRDRDSVDATLVVALRDLLAPELVAIYRLVGEQGGRRWLTRARLGQGDVSPSADGLWVALGTLPAEADLPHRQLALASQQPVAVPGALHLLVFALSSDHDAASVLEISSKQPLDSAARRTLTSILRIYRNFQALLDYSEHDTLTGLLNRKTFDEGFYKLAAQQAMLPEAALPPDERRLSPMAPGQHFICLADIDHFKQVNDQFGHLIGDEVLLLLSRLMRASFRFGDRLYRFGGEEFVVLMRCASAANAGHVLERLRARVAAYAFPQVGSLTISVGFTSLLPGDTPARAFERADRAVYWAKGHGRNQVCSFAALVERGDLADEPSTDGGVELF